MAENAPASPRRTGRRRPPPPSFPALATLVAAFQVDIIPIFARWRLIVIKALHLSVNPCRGLVGLITDADIGRLGPVHKKTPVQSVACVRVYSVIQAKTVP